MEIKRKLVLHLPYNIPGSLGKQIFEGKVKRCCFPLRTKLSMPKLMIFDFHRNSFKMKNVRPLTKDELTGKGHLVFKVQSGPYILTKE